MTRIPIRSNSRSLSASARSASNRSESTTPRSNSSNWPRTLLNTQGSPSTDGVRISASSSEGSRRVSSSDGDHSPRLVVENEDEGQGWHEAFHRQD
ncbi:hypothetical protein MKW92_021565, partial [Papaver armeniacum]